MFDIIDFDKLQLDLSNFDSRRRKNNSNKYIISNENIYTVIYNTPLDLLTFFEENAEELSNFCPGMFSVIKENDKFKDDFRIHVMRLIDCFCELLKKVDVQFFSKSKKIGNQGQSIQKRQSTVSV